MGNIQTIPVKWTFNSRGSTYTDRPDHCQPDKPCCTSSSSLIKPRGSKFPGSSVVRTGLFHCWSPGELRLCKPHGTAKRKRDRESCRKGENMLVIIRSEIATRFWRRKWQPTPVLLPGKSHGWRSLVGYTVHGIAKSQT